jgi:hypothetical protein
MTKLFGQDVSGPPYKLEITDRLIASFMALPIASDCRTSMTRLWPQFHPQTRENFVLALKKVPDLQETFLRLRFHYAALAYPVCCSWPEPEGNEVLDECYVGTAPVWRLRYLTNGRRLVDAGASTAKSWMTWLEFDTKYGLSIHSHMRTVGAAIVRNIQNATRWTKREPNVFEVSFASPKKAGCVGTLQVAAYTKEQVVAYCERRRLSILTVDEFKSVFKSGFYLKGEARTPRQKVAET